FGIRYGDSEEIAQEIVRELDATYTNERLTQLIEASLAQGNTTEAAPFIVRPAPLSGEEVLAQFAAEDWQSRYAALERYQLDDLAIEVLTKALSDDNASIRRLAVVDLGDERSDEAMLLLFKALEDASASVRR